MKRKECDRIRLLIKSSVNRLYWVAATCGKNGDLKKAKWTSIINHVSNQHDVMGNYSLSANMGQSWNRKSRLNQVCADLGLMDNGWAIERIWTEVFSCVSFLV